MKSLEDHILDIDGVNLKQDLQHEELSHNRIEEIILKSIDDQDSLFSQTFFQPDDAKKYYNEAYTKEIIDMCSSYSLNDMEYTLPEIDTRRSGALHGGHPVHGVTERQLFRQKVEKKREHVDTRPFICTYVNCFKAFKRFEHLKRHYRIHTGERPYKCPIHGCNKTFSRSDNLMQHSKTHANRKHHHEF